MVSDPLDSLLDEIRRTVSAGDLAALPGLETRLAEALERLPPEPARLAALRRKAEGNLACLAAAARGVRAARRRLEEIRQAASGTVVVYDGHGRRAETRPEAAPRHRL
ncbi:hypothetical protein EBL89_00390 [Cereibacter sphaeroides]|uniref:hypothetical protein n=1 Tax=Cereibacter sphaeroides TaxID=1063 RepID=UPI000F545B3E|nr:hypothetical protein [Cereibacter sphaeroides]AZB53848.1 hypothetical protein EBL89_00390 [Cereibacter sphaeroides]AZB58108.1 hypothetical protein EBL88_00400 [Cereibacter sphaeroides]